MSSAVLRRRSRCAEGGRNAEVLEHHPAVFGYLSSPQKHERNPRCSLRRDGDVGQEVVKRGLGYLELRLVESVDYEEQLSSRQVSHDCRKLGEAECRSDCATKDPLPTVLY